MNLYRTSGALGLALCGHALAQNYNCTVVSAGAGGSTMTANFTGNAAFAGTFTGSYNQASNPGGTRVFNLILFGPRPPAPTNLTKNMHGTGSSSGTANGTPVGTYGLGVDLGAGTVTLTSLSTNLVGPATPNTSPVSATVTSDTFSTAVPDYNYPLFIPITLDLGTAALTGMQVTQTGAVSGPLTPVGGGRYTFSLSVPADVVATLDFLGAPIVQNSTQTLAITGSVTPGPSGCAASLTIPLNQSDNNTTPQPQPPTPFDMPDPGGSAVPAHLILTLTINSQSDSISGSAALPANGVLAPAACGSADFNCDGDTGTDADIEAFFACVAGNCPGAPCGSTADFNMDGDVGTDADIEAFFRVLAGGSC